VLTGTSSLRGEILTDVRDITNLADEWGELFGRCPGATTFQRPQWILAWLDSFHPVQPFFIVVRRGSLLVGIAPLLIYQKNSESILAFAGGGVSDYLDTLIDPRWADETRAAIFNAIRSHPERWDRLELTDLPRNSTLLRQSGVGVEVHDACPVLVLPPSLEDLASVVPAHKLRNYRNAKRRLAEAGNVSTEIASRANSHDALSALFRLHAERWGRTGGPGVLSQGLIQQFHRNVAMRLIDMGIFRLYLLRLDQRVIGALYALFEGETVYCYLQGFDPEYGKMSPGTAILGNVIEAAIKHGAKKIDFLRGREPYKYSWGACDSPTYRVTDIRYSSERSSFPGHSESKPREPENCR
jgi:CelD/BcsL family acetyltransferase involved in cellulose biosynthesis